jgi:hypothetical protein
MFKGLKSTELHPTETNKHQLQSYATVCLTTEVRFVKIAFMNGISTVTFVVAYSGRIMGAFHAFL